MIYCAQIAHGRFIQPGQIGPDVVNCAECSNETSVHYKRPGHEGFCPADEALKCLVKLGHDSGWQRCIGRDALAAMQWER